MPELPDVTAYVEALGERVVGARLERLRLATPFVLRSVDPPLSDVVGRVVSGVRRLGKRIVLALEGERFVVMHSGAAHDTMCLADHVPCAMVFVPCKDGVSHSPCEDANPADAGLAAEIILNAIAALQ